MNLSRIASRVALPMKAVNVDPASYIDLFKDFDLDVVKYQAPVDAGIGYLFKTWQGMFPRERIEELIESENGERKAILQDFLDNYYDPNALNFLACFDEQFTDQGVDRSAAWLAHEIGHTALLSLDGKRLLGLLDFPNLFKLQDVEGGEAAPEFIQQFNDAQRIRNDATLAQLHSDSWPKGGAFDKNLKHGIATDLLEDMAIQVVKGNMEPEIKWDFKELFYYPLATRDFYTLLTQDNGKRPCIRLIPNESSFEFLNSKMFAFFLKNLKETLTKIHTKYRGHIIAI